jgi:2-C-methyl-D-erythritol 2,4-cyclodiphosphate synthase
MSNFPSEADRPAWRVGIGHDTHRLLPAQASPKPLRLGGVEIPSDRGLHGHSDADVLLHAITDALLGALSLGDIGELFPDTDPANRERDSASMLEEALRRVQAAGYRVINVDTIVFAQRPRLSPHKEAIRCRVAEILQLPPDRVGVKAKTGEGVDAVGREEAMMAQAVVILQAC